MFLSSNEFSLYIETLVINSKDLNHIDAILKYCKDNEIEPEDIKSLVNKSLKAKLKNDYISERIIVEKPTTTKL